MLVNVVFEEPDVDFGIDKWDFDIIDVPECIYNEMANIRKIFLNWLHDKSNDHNYWIYKDGEKYGCNYGTEEFVEWVNANYLVNKNEKVKIMSKDLREMDNEYPSIDF